MNGYKDPLRSSERSMNPQFAAHEMRDPGLRIAKPHLGGGMRPHLGGGLSSMHHTMPHLMNRSGMPHFQGGGLSNPTAQQLNQLFPYGAGGPDPQFRQFMSLLGQQATPSAKMLSSALTPTPQFAAEGGEVDQDEQDQAPPDQSVEDVGSPDDQMSPQQDQEKQIVLNAMAALDGQSPDPEADLRAFIDAFGPRALADLQQLVEAKHQEDQGSDDEQEEDQAGGPGDGQEDQNTEAADELQQAGGGLLHGEGTGQSDEIEGVTPNGRPVLLSDGEYVIDAGTVAALGDGSTKAGARRLDDMRKQIRSKAYGHDKQVKPMAKGGSTGIVLRLK